MKTVPFAGLLGLGVVCAACNTSGESLPKPGNAPNQLPEHASQAQTADNMDSRAAGGIEPQAVKVRGAANAATIWSPVDATPDPAGEYVYYLASTAGTMGDVGALYRARADGSEIATLLTGEPLSAPVGIAIATDGETLYVADMTASEDGAILRGPSAAGTEAMLAPIGGTEGLVPRAVSVAVHDDHEWIYFTGSTRGGDEPAVYRIDSRSEGLEQLASGAPLVAPAGVVATSDGMVYVVDALADEGAAALLRISDGEVTQLVGGLGVGFPAGLAVDQEGHRAFISGLSPRTGRDVVYRVELTSGAVSEISEPVGAFAEPAGLHRAHNANIFAWADSEAQGTGTVFVLSF